MLPKLSRHFLRPSLASWHTDQSMKLGLKQDMTGLLVQQISRRCDLWCGKNRRLKFLAATKQLYEWSSPSVRPSVRRSVCLSVTPFWLCSHYRIITKFSRVITNDRSDVHAKGQGHRSKIKVITQLRYFRTAFPVGIHLWWWNDA